MSDGKYVPVVFVLPDLAKSGPVQALPQAQSIKERGDKAQQASTAEGASEAARAGFDTLSGYPKGEGGGVIPGSPMTQTRELPAKLIQDKDFRAQLEIRSTLVEKQQQLQRERQELERKRDAATDSKEKGNLDMQIFANKREEDAIPGKVWQVEQKMGEMISRAITGWPEGGNASEQKGPPGGAPSSGAPDRRSSGGSL